MAFTIPDSALANVIHRAATKRNINLFSSYSFAYRPDKNVFDAIINLRKTISDPKSYVVQYDFSKYFDSISHEYIEKIVGNKDIFVLSKVERTAIAAFLRHEFAHVTTYGNHQFETRQTGVPQGSSLSLFLSNAASHELDIALERQNGSFVRFADDVVAITHSYKDALAVAAKFRAHCKVAGLKINFDKSPGIKILAGSLDRDQRDFVIDTDDGSEIHSIEYIDYLGHRIANDGVSLPDKSLVRIKRRISSIVHKHLFLHRRGAGGHFNIARIGTGYFDWDLVTCINEIRSYIYGGLREADISAFLNEHARPPYIRGLMAFFPLNNDIEQMKKLDGWLLNIICRAQRERVRVIQSFGHTISILDRQQILTGSWYNYSGVNNDSTLPSFVRAWRTSRKYYFRYGLSQIQAPSYYSMLSYE